MTSPLFLCGVGILGLILTKLSDEIAPKFKPLLLVAFSLFFLVTFAAFVSPVVETFFLLGEKSAAPELFRILYKGLGIALIVSISASFCRDLGEERIAEKMELCGKGALLYLSLPVLEKILALAKDLLL